MSDLVVLGMADMPSVPSKARPFLERALALGLTVGQYGNVYWVRSPHHHFGGHELFMYVLDGSKGGNLRAFLCGGTVKAKRPGALASRRLSKASLSTWLTVLA